MITALAVFALTLILTAMIWKIAFRPAATISTVEEWNQQKLWVNARSFAMLVDPEEEAYLRRSLPLQAFRMVQRHRAALAKECAARMARNAGMLLQLAQQAATADKARNDEIARQLASMAVRVRLHAFLAVWCLRFKWLLPEADIRIPYHYLADNQLESRLTSLYDRQIAA
jgi:hypothetical protein